MKYSLGDMVLCKEDFIGSVFSYKKGKYYYIESVEKERDLIFILSDKVFSWVFILNKYSNGDSYYTPSFEYFFYTKEEERKIKLKKLC